jgi:hypothetical protein
LPEAGLLQGYPPRAVLARSWQRNFDQVLYRDVTKS